MDVPEPDIIIYAWLPPGVNKIIASGSNHYIGLVDKNTVMKYPQIPPQRSSKIVGSDKIYEALRQDAEYGLGIEERIFQVLGHHERIVGFKGRCEDGLLIEYMPFGSVADYLRASDPSPSIQQRLKWARQAAEAVAYIHTKHILHSDISVGNFLLDEHLNVKLCDFQGKLLQGDGTVLADGGSSEGPRSSMPWRDAAIANRKSDIFALGSALYFILTGHPPFPELKSWQDREEIRRRFKESQFPPLQEVPCGDVVERCWAGRYEVADHIVLDLQQIASLS